MGLVSRLLAGGDWVHVFPEGRVRQDGELNAFKLGTAYLLCKARERDPAAPQPVVLPFFHEGMERVKPMKQMVEAGHDVRLRVGEPVALDDLLKRCGKARGQRQGMRVPPTVARVERLRCPCIDDIRFSSSCAVLAEGSGPDEALQGDHRQVRQGAPRARDGGKKGDETTTTAAAASSNRRAGWDWGWRRCQKLMIAATDDGVD